MTDSVQRVLVVGAGGHGQVVADILLAAHASGQDLRPVGFVDQDTSMSGRELQGLPLLGTTPEDVSRRDFDLAVVAIGDNRVRQQVVDGLIGDGIEIAPAVIHPAAVVARSATVGPGSVVAAGVVVNPFSTIGTNVILNTRSSVDHHNLISDYVHIAPGATLGGDVVIGGGTLIGIGATVKPQVVVGEWSVVGAGAAVVADIGDACQAVGVPARAIPRESR